MFLTALYFIMLLIFVAYVSFIWIKYGVQPSISESYYRLPKNINFLFTLFCWGFAFPVMIIGLDLTDNFLMFFAAGGIMFVGAAAAMKESLTRPVHMTAAFTGVIASQISTAYDFHMYYVNVIFIVIGLAILLLKAKNKYWWLELLAFTSMCYVLGWQLFK